MMIHMGLQEQAPVFVLYKHWETEALDQNCTCRDLYAVCKEPQWTFICGRLKCQMTVSKLACDCANLNDKLLQPLD